MRTVFADAAYWIALLNPKDRLHEAATRTSRGLGPCRIVTTEMVLVELLNGLGAFGGEMRRVAAETVSRLARDPNVEVVPQTSLQFRAAVERYMSRPDKGWGLTDCASFLVMEERELTEALTADHHFRQAGFTALLDGGG